MQNFYEPNAISMHKNNILAETVITLCTIHFRIQFKICNTEPRRINIKSAPIRFRFYPPQHATFLLDKVALRPLVCLSFICVCKLRCDRAKQIDGQPHSSECRKILSYRAKHSRCTCGLLTSCKIV